MSPVHPAPRELADLAAVMRPDWNRAELEGAIVAARQGEGGWSWPRVFIEVARLLVQEDSSPRNLTDAARRPQQAYAPPADPKVTREWAAACREVVAATRKAWA